MRQQYYTDAMANYITLQCPKEALEGYQYRMLAVNRIQGLLPCSLRTIDGETYLYYDITSRQSLARIYDRREISGRDMKKILYSITAMMKSLSEYLLDETHLIMDPEFIYYDVGSEEYWFTYYPEQGNADSMLNFLTYLSEKVGTDSAEASAVIYRLCDLAAGPGFIMREELLDREYEQASMHGVQEDGQLEDEMDLPPERNPDRRVRRAYEEVYETTEEDLPDLPVRERKSRKRGKRKAADTQGKKTGRQSPAKPAGLLVTAAVFLAAAAGLGVAGYMMPVTDTEAMAMNAGMIVCLILSIITAIYGTIYTWHKNKREDQQAREEANEERRNAMMPAAEYTAVSSSKNVV